MAGEEPKELVVVTWNVNSVTTTAANAKLAHGSWGGLLAHLGADILLVQETKLSDPAKLPAELAIVPGYQSFWAFSRTKKGYSGVAAWVADAVAPEAAASDALGGGGADIDREGRCLRLDLHGGLTIFNVYVPNLDSGNPGAEPGALAERLGFKMRFLRALAGAADAAAAAGRDVLIAGDLNVAGEPADYHPSLRVPLEARYSAEERGFLARLKQSYTDLWAAAHPPAARAPHEGYTCWDLRTAARADNRGLRIDYLLASRALAARCAACGVVPAAELPAAWSDHAALRCALRGAAAAPPPGAAPAADWAALRRRYAAAAGGGSRSIRSFFAPKPPPPAAAAAAAAGEEPAGGAAAAAPAAKKARVE